MEEMFKTPILSVIPDKAMRPNITAAGTGRTRRRLDLDPPRSPEKLTLDKVKSGIFVTTADGERRKDTGVILSYTDTDCKLIWHSDGKIEEVGLGQLMIISDGHPNVEKVILGKMDNPLRYVG